MKGPSLYGSPMKQDKSKKVKARATGLKFGAKLEPGKVKVIARQKTRKPIPPLKPIDVISELTTRP